VTPERWRRIEALYAAVLERLPEQREAFLDRACAGDPALREEVDSLRAQHEAEPTFLETPLVEAPILSDVPEEADAEDGGDRRIGPYRLIRPLGRGGMGTVYLAVRDDDAFTQYVALKVLRRGLDTEDILRRFRAERQILAQLSHPNIARLFDGGATEAGRSYLVMEYVEGEAITEYCDRRHLSIDERLELFRKVCEAVHHAHRNLVVHRDLKPSNILVTEAGEPKLLDFGIAKLLAPDEVGVSAPLTQTGRRVMTPEYAGPEQVRGEAVTTASDVYALGVLLYELLSGRRPYRLERRTVREVERVICEENPERPSAAVERTEAVEQKGGAAETVSPEQVSAARSTRPGSLQRRLRGDLDDMVLMAMRKEPERRYASAEQLSEDVRRHLDGLPVVAQPDTFTYRMKKFVRRHRVGVAASAMIVLLLAAAAIVTAVQSQRIQAQAEQVRAERDRAEQVIDFLVDLFEASDPARSGGKTLTARELLERGSRRVERELNAQPAVQAEMTAVMGRVYTSLGRYDRAEEHARRALARRKELYPARHPEIAQSLNDLGLVMNEQSRYDAADSLFRRALSLRRDHFGEHSREVAESLQNLGWLLVRTNEYEAADSLYRRALAIQRDLRGPRHPDVAETMTYFGILQRRRGNLEAAERIQRNALAIRREAYGDTHRWVGQSLNNLAIVMENKGDYAAAESLLTDAVDVWRRVLGEEHPDVILALGNLAKQYEHQERYEAAESLFRYVLQQQKQTLGDNHRLIALTLADLAGIQRKQGALDDAEALYRRALTMRRQLFGDEHREVGWTLEGLAQIRSEQQAYGDAERLYREALSIYRAALSDEHPDNAYALLGTGRMLLAQNEPIRAEPVLREALAIRADAYDDTDLRITKARLALGACLIDLTQYEEAESLLTKTRASLQEAPGAPPELTRRVEQELTGLYEAWGRPAR
jgi:serine/threonine-protein kinase